MKIARTLIFSFSLLIALSELRGQVANDNPTGVAGMFNGNVTTAGSYDPYTGNASRSITDIVVAGTVGHYGLSYSRAWNSRTPGWRSSLSWSINSITAVPGDAISYTVNFPDGRIETFSYNSSDVYFRSAPGVRERLQPWNGSHCYLILPDGGKVEFHGVKTLFSDPELMQTWYDLDFTVTAVIDPHGLRTTFTTEADGTYKITEPGGLWLKRRPMVSGVQVLEASDGRTIEYTYTTLTFGTMPYTLLTSVEYFNDPAVWTRPIEGAVLRI